MLLLLSQFLISSVAVVFVVSCTVERGDQSNPECKQSLKSGLSISESQKGRGWKGPLWVI